MDKKVFVNDQIFESDGDYILGGFETEQVDNFNFADFQSALRNRMMKLIDQYLKEAVQYNVSLGFPNAEQQAREDLGLLIGDNLKVEVPFFDTETIVDTLMNDDRTQTWLLGIKDNIKSYEYSINAPHQGIFNRAVEMDTSSPEYKNAEYFTDDCTLEQFIEQLSSIEL